MNAARVIKYFSARVFALILTTLAALYITILIANMGGYVDEIIRAGIDESVAMRVRGGWLKDVSPEERMPIMEQTRLAMYEAQGLNQPFLLRALRWLKNGALLDLGEARVMVSLRYGSDSNLVKDIILDRLPNTLLLFGVGNVMLFFLSVWMALIVSRNYHSWLDKLFVALSPISSAPSWFYGIVLLAIFAAHLRLLPYGGMYPSTPEEAQAGYHWALLKRMILPIGAVILSGFFQSVYAWRTFFLIYSQDDYVEMARARGLRQDQIESNYILRPALPALLTSFSFLLIGAWSGSALLEMVFRWPGLGLSFLTAVKSFDTPVIIGFTVIYAYMIALTILILDILYALVDPRVKIESGGQVRPARIKSSGWRIASPREILSALNPISALRDGLTQLRDVIRSTGGIIREMMKYPSAVAGVMCIFIMISVSIYVSFAYPYQFAIEAWRGQNYDWMDNPALAQPAWTNWFRRDDLPPTQILKTEDAEKNIIASGDGITRVEMRYVLNYPYSGGLPQDLVITAQPSFISKPSFITLTLIAPDGRETRLMNFAPTLKQSYYVSQDKKLQRRLATSKPQEWLFNGGLVDSQTPQMGKYALLAEVIHFEENANVEMKVVLQGKVHSWAGTDSRRRDLALPLLWGMPIALAFGLLAVAGTTILTMMIAAISTWYGGWVDSLIQRLTEVNMILPLFPVLAMAAAFYSRNIWMILGITIALSVFGSAIKNYRAIFLQFKELPYIEAASSYGASDWRIIFHYLIPRILPILIPQAVAMVPGYVFIEASLALMGMGDPRLPTWGRLLRDAYENNALIHGQYYWMLEPLAFLLFTGIAFALLGFALDRVFNPRLRDT